MANIPLYHFFFVLFGTLQMISYHFNPFVTDNSSNRIRSNVVSLVLKDDTGKALNTTDLPSYIQINIPVSNYDPGNSTRSDHFLNPGRMQYHVVTVREVNTTVKMTITTKTASFLTVYVKFAKQPTETSYDRVIYSSEERRVNSTDNDCALGKACTHSIAFECRHSGKYYFGLLEISESRRELPQSRSRRSILSERASREKCVKFKDPPPTVAPQKEYVSLVPQYDFNRSLNYSVQVETIWCAFWSETKQRWTNKGCKVRKEYTESMK